MSGRIPGAVRRIGVVALDLAREFWLPLLAGALVAGSVWWLSESLHEREGVEISRNIDTESRLLASEFTRAIANRSRRIERLAALWQSRPADETRWRADAEALLQQDAQFRAIQWLEPSLEPRWVAPRTATLPRGGLEPEDDAVRHRELEQLANLDSPVVTASVALGDAQREVLFVAPLRSDDRNTGYLIGVMRLRDLVDTVVEPELRRGFSVTVYEGPFQVFGPVWAQSGPEAQWARDAMARVDELALRVQVWPSEELHRKMRSRSPLVILILGYLLALIAAAATYLLMPVARSRSGRESTASPEETGSVPSTATGSPDPPSA